MLRRGFSTASVLNGAGKTNNTIISKAKHDIKSFMENISDYKRSCVMREVYNKESPNCIDNLPAAYTRYAFYRENSRVVNELRNKLQEMYKQKRAIPDDFITLKELKVILKDVSEKLSRAEKFLYSICDDIPNLIDSSVKQDQIQIVKFLNLPKEIKDEFLESDQSGKDKSQQITKIQENFDLSLKEDPERDHKSIGERLNILDFQTASKVSGSSWYYLINDGALLEQALVQYVMKKARKHGFSMCIPPSIVKDEVSRACGFKPRDQNNEQQTYEISGSNLVLTGTAEIPLAGLLVLNKLYEQKSLPSRLVGVSRSYRAEAGARGRDTKGLYRVHEFTKVELFITCEPEKSNEEFDKIIHFQEEVISELGLLARVINIPANDLGAPAYKKYDIESWMPGRGNWGELTSTSTCTDFQSRRFNGKYLDAEGHQQFLHTLNGTAMAIPRVIVALIETHYDKNNDCIWIPAPLQPYMDDKECIKLKDDV